MEWLIGIYLAVGIIKTLNRLANPNPALKPSWMSLERDPIKITLLFTFNVLLWPLAGG
jgi:hypothetical protein